MVSLERLYVDAILLGMGRRGHDGGCRGKVERRWAAVEDMGEGTGADGDGGGRGGGQRRWTRGQRRGEQLWTAMADGRGKGGGGGGGRSWQRQPGEDGVRRNGNLGGGWLG
jgi:hypothetical protein